MNGKDIKNDLKKALHRAIAKAYVANNKVVRKAVDTSPHKDALAGVIADLKDPDSQPSVPSENLPAQKDSVLNKDDPTQAQMYDMKQDQAKAKVGMLTRPEATNKGPKKLSSFMTQRQSKLQKAKVDEGKSDYDKKNARAARNIDRHFHSNEGVNPPTDKKGVSDVGHGVRQGNKPMSSIKGDETGNEMAKRVLMRRLAALRAKKMGQRIAKMEMAKSESTSLGKARVDEGLSPSDKKEARSQRNYRTSMSGYNQHLSTHGVPKDSIKGVHTPEKKFGEGVSHAGRQARLATKYRNKMNGFPEDHVKYAKRDHKEVLSDLANMPKPNLGKARVDENLSWGEKRKERSIRKEPNDGHIKGVHEPFYDKGVSGAGAAIRSIPRDPNYPHGIYGIGTKESATRDAVNRAKEKHNKVLSQQKQMPKPNLGKARVDEGKSKEEKVKAREARNTRFPKRWVSGKQYPAQEGEFAGRPKGNSSQQSGVHEGRGNFIQGGPGSFSDNPGAKRDKIDVQAGHSMVMQGLKNQKKPNLGKSQHPGPSKSEHQKIYDAKQQSAQEAHLKTPQGEAERQKRNAEMRAKHFGKSDEPNYSRNVWHPTRMKEGDHYDFQGKKYKVVSQEKTARQPSTRNKPYYYTTISEVKDTKSGLEKGQGTSIPHPIPPEPDHPSLKNPYTKGNK